MPWFALSGRLTRAAGRRSVAAAFTLFGVAAAHAQSPIQPISPDAGTLMRNLEPLPGAAPSLPALQAQSAEAAPAPSRQPRGRTARVAAAEALVPDQAHHSLLLVNDLIAANSAPSPAPDAGSLLRSIERAPGLPPSPPAEAPRPGPDELRVLVRDFHISGVTLNFEARLKERLLPFIGKKLDLAGLEAAVAAVTEVYREQGYVAHAYLPPQAITDGIVDIVIVEGKLGKVRVAKTEPSPRLSGDRAARTLSEHLPVGEPLKTEQLERNVLLLKDLAGVNASVTLVPGAREGEIDAHLVVSDTPLLTASIGVGNGGAPGTGANQVAAALFVNGAAGIGERLSLSAIGASGLDYARAAVAVPIAYSGLSIGANIAALRYRLGGNYAGLDASGEASSEGLAASYPIIRSRARNLYLDANFERRHYVNRALGEISSDKRADVLSFGLAGNSLDGWFGGAYSNYAAALTGGRLDLSASAASLAIDAASAQTQGDYSKFSWTASRLQAVTAPLTLYASLSGQFAGKNLDSSEKFYLGGPNGVRAYPVNEAGGDEGWLASLELRGRLECELQAVVFADFGGVRQNRKLWAAWAGNANVPNRIELAGLGFGLNWTTLSTAARLSVAWRLGSNPLSDANGKDSDGTRRIPRVWVQLNQYF